jgi:hypothetical protein
MRGAPSSIRIAAKGAGPPPVLRMPEAASSATASSATARFVQPAGTPSMRVTGSTVSTWSARPAAGELIPAPETAATCR